MTNRARFGRRVDGDVGLDLLHPRFDRVIHGSAALEAAPVGNWAQTQASAVSGQFAVGLVLGAAWRRCVCPTLGAASVLAARSENLRQVSLTLFAFGVGAAAPMLAIGLMSRQVPVRWRRKLLKAGRAAKQALGLALLVIGLLVLSGLGKRIEAVLVDASPAWLTMLATRF